MALDTMYDIREVNGTGYQRPTSDAPISGGVGAVLKRGTIVRDTSDAAHENAVARMMQET